MYPNEENVIIVPITKRIKIITSIQASLILLFHRWTLIIGKMVETKAFLANPKHQCCLSQSGEYDCSANNKKNGDYYEYPSLPHFLDKHWLWGKMVEGKVFLANPKHQSQVSQ